MDEGANLAYISPILREIGTAEFWEFVRDKMQSHGNLLDTFPEVDTIFSERRYLLWVIGDLIISGQVLIPNSSEVKPFHILIYPQTVVDQTLLCCAVIVMPLHLFVWSWMVFAPLNKKMYIR